MTTVTPTDDDQAVNRLAYPVDSATHACCQGIGRHTPDCCPGQNHEAVDLDTSAPAVVRWKELAEREIAVYHDGDASKLIPFPRPAWADPECDIIGPRLDECYYTSDWVEIPLAWTNGHDDGEEFAPATMRVRAKLCGDGSLFIGLSERRWAGDAWRVSGGVGLAATEATELAQALLAAVDVISGAQEANSKQ